ncbi:MAG TPA: hypothetical protein VFF44_02175 [Casimicrobiaceae bacterium]|nr:hypothetical protein [Casimicrobiaceae bacterium]
MRRLSIFAAAFAMAALPSAAQALTCYTVLDRTDATIYQNTEPPFDLSTEGGAAARDTLRSRHEFLTISETDRCPPVSAPPGATGYQPASVDDIVAGIRPYGAGAVGSAGSAGRAGNARAAAAALARSSSSARKY